MQAVILLLKREREFFETGGGVILYTCIVVNYMKKLLYPSQLELCIYLYYFTQYRRSFFKGKKKEPKLPISEAKKKRLELVV